MARRTAAEAEQTRITVLATARRLFAEQGYHGVSVPECAEAAGVTHGGLYHHFTSKRELFRAVFAQLTDELNESVMAQALEGSTTREMFLRGARASILYMTNDEYQRIALTDAPSVFGWDEWRSIDSQIGFPTMVNGIRALQREGLLGKAPDPTALAVLLFGGLTEAALRTAAGDDDVDVEAVILTIDQLITSLS